LRESKINVEQYNDTKRWHCYEAALLIKKNAIRTDEETPLTTPVDVSVLEYYRPPLRDRVCVGKQEIEKSIFRKREKAKEFSFSIKEIYPSLALVSILQ